MARPTHHSTGRALARLPLLILIHPPLRQAEWRCSSGGGRAAQYAGAKRFGSFLAFEKGTRCKSETDSGHHRSNGYVHLQEIGRL
ncbi:hypothetical protein FPT12_06950 [Pseudomonas sp. H3(2019)]|nr:hypothetical protein FPT12_06950 [Pseudomonas sp. H3(2019)]